MTKPLSYPGQTSNQYEMGLQATLVENVLFAHAAVYRNDYHDLQIPVLVAGASTYYLPSAPGASIDGLEFGTTWNAARGLEIYSIASFQHGQYGPGFALLTAAVLVNCSDNRLVSLPAARDDRLQFHAGITDTRPASLSGVHQLQRPLSKQRRQCHPHRPRAIAVDASIGYDFRATGLVNERKRAISPIFIGLARLAQWATRSRSIGRSPDFRRQASLPLLRDAWRPLVSSSKQMPWPLAQFLQHPSKRLDFLGGELRSRGA